jgi:hypothetical protein
VVVGSGIVHATRSVIGDDHCSDMPTAKICKAIHVVATAPLRLSLPFWIVVFLPGTLVKTATLNCLHIDINTRILCK